MRMRNGGPSLALETSLVQDNQPIEVFPRVFIGSLHAAFNADEIEKRGITHIINASGLPCTFPKQYIYLTIGIRDKVHSNLLSCIPVTNIFIEAATEKGGVLVHCSGGRSRSPAFVIAYMMSSLGMVYDQALKEIQIVRSVVKLNAGFVAQLKAYGEAHHDVFLAHQLLLRMKIDTIARQRQRKEMMKKKDGGGGGDDGGGSPLVITTAKQEMLTLPSCLRLSRPGSPSVQVIPPLRAMGDEYICRFCSHSLFHTNNILSHDHRTIWTLEKNGTSHQPHALQQQHHDHGDSRYHSQLKESEPDKKCNVDEARKREEYSMFVYQSQKRKPFILKQMSPTTSVWNDNDRDENCPMTISSPSNGAPILLKTLPTPIKRGRTETKMDGSSVYSFSSLCFESLEVDDDIGEQEPVRPHTAHPLFEAESKKEKPGQTNAPTVSNGVQQRPESAEKRRWIRSMNALEKLGGGKNSGDQIKVTAALDEYQLSHFQCQHCYIEPLNWMLKPKNDVFATEQDEGVLNCPNEKCQKTLGVWSWNGLRCKCGGLLSPAFRIDKDMVQKVKHIAPSSVSPSSVASTASVEHHEHQQSSPANQRGKNVKGFFE